MEQTDVKALKDELRKLITSMRGHIKENRKQARECAMSEPKRAENLEGGAEAFEHAINELRRIIQGKTEMEALAERLIKGRTILRK